MSPNQIVPTLADQGAYIASESSFYHVLRQKDQLAHRGKAKAPKHKRPEAIEAPRPNELWSWDITYLPTTIKELFFYLYMIMDIYSRKIVGWEVHDSESTEHSSLLIRKTYLREGVAGKPLVLHSDQWVLGFQHWYNEIHRHSALNLGKISLIVRRGELLYNHRIATSASERKNSPSIDA